MLNCSDKKGLPQTKLSEYMQFVPEAAENWVSAGEGEVYSDETIYDYMDGAAEIYKQYSFVSLYVGHYEKPGDVNITLEIFEMETSQDAFGIFSHIRSGENAGIGQDSDKTDGTLSFWKDKYFVYIRTERESPAVQKTFRSIAQSIDLNLSRTGERPKIVEFLPGSGLVENSIRYSRSFILFNSHYFIASENILNINSETDAVLASYLLDNEESVCLVVHYPSKESAENARNSFIHTYMPDTSENHIVQTENGKWTGILLKEDYLILLFDAPSEAQISRFLVSFKVQ